MRANRVAADDEDDDDDEKDDDDDDDDNDDDDHDDDVTLFLSVARGRDDGRRARANRRSSD